MTNGTEESWKITIDEYQKIMARLEGKIQNPRDIDDIIKIVNTTMDVAYKPRIERMVKDLEDSIKKRFQSSQGGRENQTSQTINTTIVNESTVVGSMRHWINVIEGNSRL